MTDRTNDHQQDHELKERQEQYPIDRQYVEQDEDEIDLLDLLLVFARNKKLIFWVTFGFAALTAVYSLIVTPVYTANTRLISPSDGGSRTAAMLAQMNVPDFAMNMGGGTGGMILAIAKSRSVLNNMVDKFELVQYYESESKAAARRVLSEKVSTTQDEETGVITISVNDNDPELAAEMANAFVAEIRDVAKRLSLTESSQQRLFLEQQLKQVQLDLLKSEERLKEYQQRTGIVEPGEQATKLMEQIAELRAQIAAKEVQLEGARTFATARNPQVKRLQAELEGLREQLRQLETQAAEEEGVYTSETELSLQKLPERRLEYLRILRDNRFNETLYQMLVKQYEGARMAEARDPSIIQVLDEAVPPEQRSKPKRKLMVVLATVLGFFLATFMAFIREFTRNASRDPERAQKMQQLRDALRLRKKRV